MGDNSSTCGGIASALWDSVSAAQVVQYSRDKISKLGDSFSLVKGIQYIGDDNFSTVGVPSVLWGITSVL